MTVLSAFCRLIIFVFAGFWLSGCSPIAESELDEQKNPHFLTGRSRANTMDYKGAVAAFEKAIEANPRSASAHLELGLLYLQKENDFAAAIYHFEKHLKLRPNSNVAEMARQHIVSCKMELARTVSFALVNQKAHAALDRLTTENAGLRQQVEQLKGQLSKAQLVPLPSVVTNRPTPAPNIPLPSQSGPAVDHAMVRTQQPPAGKAEAVIPRPAIVPRTHVVRSGETFASIARSYRVPLTSLQSANPRVEARKLKVGQSVSIPGSKN